jgi:epoxyqueuosine reductase QueG
MRDSSAIKKTAAELGFDLCGIAPAERFEAAPRGYHPREIYPKCRSVIVYAKQMPGAPLFATNLVPYTLVCRVGAEELDRLGLRLCLALEKSGIGAVIIPSDDPYEHWEAARQYGRAILSLRHAGRLAGLGALGRNTLLMNREFGSLIQLGAVLSNVEIEPDALADFEACPPDCRLCLEVCPQKALDGTTVDQKLCRAKSIIRNEKGYVLKGCNLCRRVCPRVTGF